jgi:hypothetical protein
MCVEVRTQDELSFNEMLKVARASAPLTVEERALAVRLAEQGLRSNKLLPEKKTFLTMVQTHRNGEAEKKGVFERHALLTYYQYAGDVGILVYVNLVRQRMIKVEQLPSFPAPFAPEEFQRAREIALNHPQLTKVLEPYRDRLTVEALLTRSHKPRDPLFRHRLAYLLFRVGPRYLTAQGEVLVDLTTETVIIQPAQLKQSGGHRH